MAIGAVLLSFLAALAAASAVVALGIGFGPALAMYASTGSLTMATAMLSLVFSARQTP